MSETCIDIGTGQPMPCEQAGASHWVDRDEAFYAVVFYDNDERTHRFLGFYQTQDEGEQRISDWIDLPQGAAESARHGDVEVIRLSFGKAGESRYRWDDALNVGKTVFTIVVDDYKRSGVDCGH